jgi:hypothetical protein
MALVARHRPFTKEIMAISAVFMRPLLAKLFKLSGRCCGYSSTITGYGYIFMADKTPAHPFGLMRFMIEGHTLLELHNISGLRSDGKKYKHQSQLSQNDLRHHSSIAGLPNSENYTVLYSNFPHNRTNSIVFVLLKDIYCPLLTEELVHHKVPSAAQPSRQMIVKLR